MDLYLSPISAYSRKVLLAFYEKDVPFNAVEIDLTDAQVRQQYRQLYPLGKVPCLKVGATLVPESSNIIEWLDQHYQVNKLLPAKPEEARVVRNLDSMIDQYVTANAILLFFQSFRPIHLQDAERIETAKVQIAYMYADLERRLNEQPQQWLVGGQLSMADLSLAAALTISSGIASLDQLPKLAAYLQMWQQRDSFIRAREGFDQAVAKMMAAQTARWAEANQAVM